MCSYKKIKLFINMKLFSNTIAMEFAYTTYDVIHSKLLENIYD